ncbi:monoacylglycerol lipase ABHD6-like isoform X2 [Salvia splendens]|uniref:monoacylglycerol lipase ABHD6-like isoform X2 n=1 Tax=Salvia splendens TaxID=180675 RepID=UPI001C2611E8|nr:monoacylglycerol lipase ABHD6-like isoform X2 [Salvia splendens]
MARCLSLTGSADFLYRSFFSYSGLRSMKSDLQDGTVMHCWVPKSHKASKPSLLLVHGFGANAMWQYGDLLHHLMPRYNIYVPDLLFFGESWTQRPDRSEAFQARCLMRLMELHGVRRLSLVGISYGGFVSYSMAAQFPEAVEKVVLCCSGVCLEEKDLREGFFQVADLDEVAGILMPQTPEKLRELIKFAFAKPVNGLPSCFLSDYIDVFCTEFITQKKELIRALTADRKLDKIPKIEQDKIFPLELGYRLQRHIGDNAKIEVIKNAGHALNIEKPREFAKHLKAFLIETSSTPRSISSSALSLNWSWSWSSPSSSNSNSSTTSNPYSLSYFRQKSFFWAGTSPSSSPSQIPGSDPSSSPSQILGPIQISSPTKISSPTTSPRQIPGLSQIAGPGSSPSQITSTSPGQILGPGQITGPSPSPGQILGTSQITGPSPSVGLIAGPSLSPGQIAGPGPT